MVKTIVALLTLLLVLVGPASAQEPEPPNEEPAPDEGAPASDETQTQDAESADAESADAQSAEAQSADAEGTDGSSSEGGDAAPTDTMTGEQAQRACRLAVTHIADPTMSPNRWVIPDPDGCIRRTVDRIVGTIDHITPTLVRRYL